MSPSENVLIVEDDPGIAELERNQLESAGLSVLVAADAESAMVLLRTRPICLVLLDYRIPGAEDGLAFYEEMKSMGFDLPVILVTGFSHEELAIRALRAGVRDFVTKSLAYLEYLPEAVTRVLGQVQTEARLAHTQARLDSADSHRRRIEEAQRLFRALLDRTNDAIEVIDPDSGRFLDANQKAWESLGYTRDEFMELRVVDIDRGVARVGWPEIARELAERGSRVLQSVHRRKDGSEFPVEVQTNLVHLERDYTVAVVRDVSDRHQAESRQRALESQLRSSQKMEAFGQLAGGVAHDFNNLLTVISGYCEMLTSMTAEDDPMRELIGAIGQAGARAASLTRQLLAFSRKTMLESKVTNLNEIVRETEKMLRRLIGEDILFHTMLDPSLRQVRVDESLIGQVLMNFVVNARDAMPRGGKLGISTANLRLERPTTCSTGELTPGDYVQLTVEDSGSGMSEDVKSRIFEPFFTTKEIGRGTGLGLSVVHGIVIQSGGQVDVQSEPGRGTRFRIALPVFDGPPTRTALSYSRQQMAGTETVLLVEDDEDVRDLTSRVLRSHGYRVLVAANGNEALRVAAEHSGPIELLLTDVVMPHMGGRQLADRLLELRPQLKVIFMSGYTNDAVLRNGVEGGAPFLQKPVAPVRMASKVREVLDSPRG